MGKLRIHPRAVCRNLISALDAHKPLSGKDERRVLYAIEKTGISLERVLASLSKGAIERLLKEF